MNPFLPVCATLARKESPDHFELCGSARRRVRANVGRTRERLFCSFKDFGYERNESG